MALGTTRLAFIGGGTMAEAMVRGILERKLVTPARVTVSGPRRERRAELTKTYRVRALASNVEAARNADVVVMSVKPQMLPRVMAELRGKLAAEQLVLSIVAGASSDALRAGLDHASIVRAMPNTPAQVAMGVTVWWATPSVSAAERDRARALLAALGEELEVEQEEQVDMATALSGTGPSYIFLLMEALVDAGVHLGFSRRVAEELVLRTVEGSALFARRSGRHLAELRNMVTSPGGTSAAALYQLEKGGLRTVLSKAVYAAYQRTRELGESAEGRRSRPEE
jgi:pyrroline-5-carboxylate reductase